MGIDYVEQVVRWHPDLARPSIHNPIPLPGTRNPSQVANRSDRTSSPVENRTIDERVNEAMKSEIVAAALAIGFHSAMIRKLVRIKLESDDVEYASVFALVEDLQREEDDEKADIEITRYFLLRSAHSMTSSAASSYAA